MDYLLIADICRIVYHWQPGRTCSQRSWSRRETELEWICLDQTHLTKAGKGGEEVSKEVIMY